MAPFEPRTSQSQLRSTGLDAEPGEGHSCMRIRDALILFYCRSDASTRSVDTVHARPPPPAVRRTYPSVAPSPNCRGLR
jgi:hypothetical protein